MVDRRDIVLARSGSVAVTAGSALAVLGTFMPWLRSGSRNRSSYTIFDLVERLGFAPGGMVAWSLRLWPLVPLAFVLIAIGAWWVHHDRRVMRPLVIVVATLAVWVGATVVALLVAPDVALFGVGVGPYVCAVGVVFVVAGTVTLSRRGSAASAAS